MNLRPSWLRPPLILVATASGLRVDDGRSRVQVVAEGHGRLRCGHQAMLVRGRAELTFLVSGVLDSVTVEFRGLGGKAHVVVGIPRGHDLARVPTPVVIVPTPSIAEAALRPLPAPGPVARPFWLSVGPGLKPPTVASFRPAFARVAFMPPRHPKDPLP